MSMTLATIWTSYLVQYVADVNDTDDYLDQFVADVNDTGDYLQQFFLQMSMTLATELPPV